MSCQGDKGGGVMGVYIIAEIGVNHNGNLNTAKKLIKLAKESGCDCVKFQVFSADRLVTLNAPKAEYQIKNTCNNDSQYTMLKNLELEFEDFLILKNYCDKCQIDFLATPFDEEAVDILERLKVDSYKISSGDITNKPLLQYIASKGKRIFLSTGMSDLEEVRKAICWINDIGNRDIVLFHCTSNYPAAYDSVNMKAMLALKEKFKCPVGYSDHTKGIEVPILAVAYGAEVVEKHFTYDKMADGPDHKASLDFEELKQMVISIRNVEVAIGNGEKCPNGIEKENRRIVRKSLVWKKNKKRGDVISNDDICFKRPGTGILPENIDLVVGKQLKIDCEENTLVKWDDFE